MRPVHIDHPPSVLAALPTRHDALCRPQRRDAAPAGVPHGPARPSGGVAPRRWVPANETSTGAGGKDMDDEGDADTGRDADGDGVATVATPDRSRPRAWEIW